MTANTTGQLQSILDIEYFSESSILNLLPAAVYVCDGSGQIVKYNQKAVELWGRTPQKGDKDERFCGSFKLYRPDGSFLPHNETPVAACLKDGLHRQDLEVIIERPDLSRIVANVNITPIKNGNGDLIGMINCFYDITGQKEAQKELDWKTKELQDYVDNASIGLHWVDENGIIKWANKAELDMLGYVEHEYVGHHISEFHLEKEKIDDILHRLICNEILHGYESTLKCKNGSTRDVQISSSVFWYESKFIHTRCFTVDVTEQKRLYQALKESEGNYRNLIQSLDTPLYTTDAEGRITMFNRAAANLWGREPEIGKDLWCGSYRIFKPDGSELPLDCCPMAICLKEHRPVVGEEILVVRPDGKIRNVAPHPQPLFDSSGKLSGAINMLIDITTIKETEKQLLQSEQNYRALAASLERRIEEKTHDLLKKNEELRKSEERYHRMIEEVEDYAIILLDRDGTILNWNKGAEKIKGYKDEEIVGKNFNVFYQQEDLDDDLPRKLINQAVTTGRAAVEGWRVRKDGSKFWGSIVITALHDEKQNIIGFTKVTRDLTEKKAADDKLREYSAELEFQNAELEQFAYAASHDMKEPLRKIAVYNAYIKDSKSDILDDRSKDFLDRSLNAVKKMSSLIEDLLTYSRTTSTADSFEKVNLQSVVDEIISEHRDELIQKNINVETNALPVIEGIPFQCKQLMYNIIGNSIKYSSADRVGYIKISSKQITGSDVKNLKTSSTQLYRQITIEDNGVGFEQEYAEKIFEVFQRLDNHSSAKGSGIGLALCKKIVQNHKGLIVAKGKVNEGARFDIYLPERQINLNYTTR